MLTETQARTMLLMQARMNSKVDPDWVNAAYPYLRAVVIEGAEAIEHHGWKWWKKQQMDLPQLQMELIDIWHFMMSELLLQQDGDENPALQILMKSAQKGIDNCVLFDNRTYAIASISLLEKLQLLIGTSAAGRVEVGLFAAIMHDCGMTWHDLYAQYVGKNVLNFFRQDHGYKEGTYRKLWMGREDNEHLVEIMQELDPQESHYQEQLYNRLTERYGQKTV